MLKMKCSNCTEEIISPLLAEIKRISCPHCQKSILVKDVIISAQGYSYHRNDLMKRLFRYKTLIAEVTKERELMEKSPEASTESKNSLSRFLATLEEMMAGARDNLRIEFAWPPAVNFQTNRLNSSGYLVNLSMEGACIEVESGKPLPKKKAAVTINFALPEDQGSVTLCGTVVRITKASRHDRPHPQVGISFAALDQEVHSALWAIISASATSQE